MVNIKFFPIKGHGSCTYNELLYLGMAHVISAIQNNNKRKKILTLNKVKMNYFLLK